MPKLLRFLFRKKEPAAVAVVSPAAGVFSPAAAASSLLRDVLSEAQASGPGAHLIEKKGSALPLSQRLNIGAKMADARRHAIETATRLLALSDEDTAREIALLAEDLEKRVCRIAFAGQINAGKSSLINVLVEKPELLPSSINPWTTVITRVHCGVLDKPVSEAVFTFFNREEWRQLSTGGRTRLLTERLFPDFDWKALKSQVDEMEARAAQKLGDSFEELLGTQHSYSEITPGLLNRYVGAGHHDAEGRWTGTEGKYAEITKLADIFLDLGAFNFPTVLIDTPGVNDPFLVRDEITRQNLEAADICVIVLTAKQPLSAADLDLLRTMRGLKKDRIVIFINKIDEINGGEEVLKEISRRARVILKEEFPSAHIPIVFGSAIWGRKALSFRAPASQKTNSGTDGRHEGANSFDWPSHVEIANAVTEETYFLKSGLSLLAVSISELVSTGPISDTIVAASTTLDAICRNMISWLEVKAAILSEIPINLGAAKSALSTLMELRAALVAEFDTSAAALDAIRTEKITALRQDMAQTLQASLTDTLAALSQDALFTQTGPIDAKLRAKLESIFLDGLEGAGGCISLEEERLRAELARLLQASGLKVKLATDLGHEPNVSPSLAALSEPAAFGITAKLKEFAASPGPAKTESTFHKAMLSGFESIMENLAEEADRVLRKRSEGLIHHVKALLAGPLSMAIHGISTAIENAETPSSSDTEEQLELRVKRLHEKIAALKGILTGQSANFA